MLLCSFGNHAPTQHYTARALATNHELDTLDSEVLSLVRNKIWRYIKFLYKEVWLLSIYLFKNLIL